MSMDSSVLISSYSTEVFSLVALYLLCFQGELLDLCPNMFSRVSNNIAPYNISATNPVGKAIVPGIHKLLDQEVKEALQSMPSSRQKALAYLPLSMITTFLLSTLLVPFIYCK